MTSPNQDVENTPETMPNDAELPVGSRRALLGAAGGFVLAASGLMLPGWLQEAEARGALHGARGGRRGRDHKGRHKQRSHGDKKENNKDQDKPRGFGLNGIEFTIVVDHANGKTFDMQYYSASDPFGNYKIQGGDIISTDGKQTGFKTISTSAFVWINNRYYIEATNPFAALLNGKVGHGGRIDGAGWHDGTLVGDGPLDNRFAWTVGMEVDGIKFVLSHLDTDAKLQHVKLSITA